MNVAAYVPDLIDRSKVAAAAPGCRFVSSPAALVGMAGIDLVVVDLRQPGVLEVLPDIATPTIAFSSHTDRTAMAAAAGAGATVLPRSEFFSRIGELLAPGGRGG